LRLLYFSRGHTIHDRRFLTSFVEAGFETAHLRLLDEQLDRSPVPAGVELLGWTGETRPLRGALDLLRRRSALRELLERWRPDVVLAGPIPECAFLVAAVGFRPLVAMSWGSDILTDTALHGWNGPFARYALRHASAAFGDCDAVRQRLLSLGFARDDRILTFPWGIDLETFYPAPSSISLRKDLGWDDDDPVIVSTRTWEAVYAIDVLMRAFGKVHQAYPEAKLLLIGDGSRRAEIKGLVSALGLEESVHMPGRVDHTLLPDYLRLADLYVSSALSDGTSVSLLEAMGCGLPVVVSAAFGNLEWIDPGRNGWLAAPGDDESFATAMRTALDARPRFPEIAATNLAVVRARADWKANSPALPVLLKQVSDDASVPGGHGSASL
jgi:L-malate glycosyltransferase